jgi:hypothetical protein
MKEKRDGVEENTNAEIERGKRTQGNVHMCGRNQRTR